MSRFITGIAKTILLSTIALAAVVQAQPSQYMVLTAPYVGIDAEIRHITWGTNLGSNVFKTNYPQGKIYGGLRFCDFVGVEVGYEATLSRTAKNMLPAGSLYLGQPLTGLAGPTLVEGTFEISGPYAGILGFLPITCYDSLFLSIGAVNLKASHTTYILGDGGLGVLNPAATMLRFSQRKTVLRIAGGWEHLFWDCVGLRLNLAWENTSRFSQIRPENSGTSLRRVTLRNSWNYGFGIFYQF